MVRTSEFKRKATMDGTFDYQWTSPGSYLNQTLFENKMPGSYRLKVKIETRRRGTGAYADDLIVTDNCVDLNIGWLPHGTDHRYRGGETRYGGPAALSIRNPECPGRFYRR
ncbi:MAG: hypothetical protein MZV49_13425 [Rhodopseudomonas palustris]|nr:hypothetical protein [Rhodopseudomonas palustris]